MQSCATGHGTKGARDGFGTPAFQKFLLLFGRSPDHPQQDGMPALNPLQQPSGLLAQAEAGTVLSAVASSKAQIRNALQMKEDPDASVLHPDEGVASLQNPVLPRQRQRFVQERIPLRLVP